MTPLIEIQTIPIEIQLKRQDAKLEYARGTAEMEITRDQKGLTIKSNPLKVNIDTFEARNSVIPSHATNVKNEATKGLQQAYSATAQMAQEGRLLMEAKVDGETIPQFARNTVIAPPGQSTIEFMPDAPVEFSFEGGEMSIQYEMDKLNFNWRLSQMDFTFVPGDIELTVTQQPDIIIKYVGEPLYVPPSSNPNHVPVDVQA